MEREISVAVEIAVALIAVSALIGIIWFTVFMGKDMANSVTVEASELSGEVTVAALNDMCDKDNVMPTSAVYSILRTYGNYIPQCKCGVCENQEVQNLLESPPCILNHLTGKVNLGVKVTDNGWYSVEIHDMNCEYSNVTPVCKCKLGGWFNG